jgi:hypothetical protein
VICPSWLPMRRSSFGVWNSRNIDAELIVSRRKWSSVLCGRPSARHTLVTGYNLEVDEIFWELDEIFLRVLPASPSSQLQYGRPDLSEIFARMAYRRDKR